MHPALTPDWQPLLSGKLIKLRPMAGIDFESLYLAASDPLIWEQHPDRKRYQRDRFELFFRSGMDSKGALVVIDQNNDAIIGGSRFTSFDAKTSSVEVGYTFLSRQYWGRGYNGELKKLMLDHAFRFVDSVFFFVGETNYRSQKAMLKLRAVEVRRETSAQLGGDFRTSVVYQMKKQDWFLK